MSKLSEPAQAIRVLLQKNSQHTAALLPAMQLLNSEELVQLHQWMQSERLPPLAYNCFSEFLKLKGQESALIYFLSQITVLDLALHKTLLGYLHDSDLLIVVEHLLARIQKHPEAAVTLQPTLLFFCERLYAEQKANAVLNQWMHKAYTAELIHYLMSYPDCAVHLTQPNSTLYSFAAWSSPCVGLKYRMDALLNCDQFSKAAVKHYAIIWLTQLEPQHLETLFSTLNSSKENRTDGGKQNLLELKHAFWFIIRGAEEYKEEEFLALFKTPRQSLSTAAQVQTEYQQLEPYHQARLLAKSNQELAYHAEQWIALLGYSLTGILVNNWHKASLWLEQQNESSQLAFIHRLLASSSHPLFNQQAHKLVIQCKQYITHSQTFKEHEFSWLVQHCAKESVAWSLTQVQHSQQKRPLNLGLFFSLLPNKESLLTATLQHELCSSAEVVADIYAAVSIKADNSLPLNCMADHMSSKDKIWIKHFFNRVLPALNDTEPYLISVSILTNLLLRSAAMCSPHQADDVQLMLMHLDFLLHLTKKTYQEESLQDFKKITFQFLHTLITSAEPWSKALLPTPLVGQLLHRYLPQCIADPTVLMEHYPLTDLLLSPNADYVPTGIKQSESMQLFVQRLLIQSPAPLNEQQFTVLFAWLVAANKITTSQTILALSEQKEAQRANIYLMVPYIAVQEAYTLFLSSKNRILALGIITHPQALEELSAMQWHNLLQALDAQEFVAALSNEQTALPYRLNGLKGFYKAHNGEPTALAAQLKQWQITEEQLIVLADYTSLEEQECFTQLIKATAGAVTLSPPSLLHKKSLRFMIEKALTDPARYALLLEPLLDSAAYQTLCQQLLQNKLTQLLSISPTTPCSTFAQLDGKQPEGYTAELIVPILALQRLIYYVKPIDELACLMAQAKQPYKKAFCAAASLYQTLLDLKKSSNHPLDGWFSCLYNQEKNRAQSYVPFMLEWQKKGENNPAMLFHWLRWKAGFFAAVYNEQYLAQELMLWLSRFNINDSASTNYLKRLITCAAELKQLTPLLQHIKAQPSCLNKEQTEWLCKASLDFLAQEPQLIASIISLNSWHSLQAYLACTPHYIAILQAALSEARYCAEITDSEEQQTQFIRCIAHRCTPQQIVQLLPTTTDSLLKSLLIIHLLSQASYLNSLQAPSFIEQLHSKLHQPSRLNPLVQQINPNILCKSRTQNLAAETALSVLCSLPHFHQLSFEQVQHLFTKLPQASTIEYWLHHYATMPNAYYIVAHLLGLAETTVCNAINKLSDDKKEWLMYRLVEHLDLIPLSNKIMEELEQEKYLIYAIRLYKQGTREQHYPQFITQLTERLVQNKHSFSVHAIPLIISLHNDPHCSALKETTAYLINHNLRTHAESNSLALFYDGDKVNTANMMQLIPVTPKYLGHKKNNGLLANLLKPILSSEENPQGSPKKMHPLLEIFVLKQIKEIKAFDYFLIHCTENSIQLQRALHDYLSYFAQEPCTDVQRKAVSHLATFITRKELNPPVKEALYHAFLTYPNLLNSHSIYCLFLYNAKKTIQYFGLQGTKKSYLQVISLCTQALAKLDPKHHGEMIHDSKKALFEAQTELAFAENNGFFARMFRRLQRCWAYGWTGFFIPKLPTYVIPLEKNVLPPNMAAQKPYPQISPMMSKEIPVLLAELNHELTLPLLDELMQQLQSWNFNKEQECGIRYQVHSLFHRLLDASNNDVHLAGWLATQQTVFVTNRFYLLERLLAANKPEPLFAFLKEINADSSDFHYVAKELTPPPVALDTKPLGDTLPPKSLFLHKATSLMQTALNWSTAFSFFAKPEEEKTTDSAQQQTASPA